MRPVMRFVDTASRFSSMIHVRKGDFQVDGKNPMEMILLEATQGTQLEIVADGPDSSEALEALSALIKNGFGES